ncbi:MAG: 2-isopropylmalate synthase [Synergistota bacterium]|nr:2-isopropylmalate synthase [Synergistota bacterium]
MRDYVRIFDTTLRDGEQAPGINLNTEEKLQIAAQLARMKVDVIEAGFPAASPGDFEAVKLVADRVEGPIIAGLARTRREDVQAAAAAVKGAKKPRIHTFIATSPIHMEYKLKMTPEQVLAEVRRAVTHARGLVEDVEFSAEDASRSDPAFLGEVFRTAFECGATTLNIPDTVGYSVPDEFGEFVRAVIGAAGDPEGVIWSVHCHNDLGLAVANSLAAVRAGARQVECTVNGLGERAGNASMEEVVMALRTRGDRFGCRTGMDTTRLCPVSSQVSRMTGFPVPPNKAVVGANAFAHEAGIHQHGVLCNRETYEIMNPEDVGASGSRLVLGKHSGKHAFRQRVEEMGFTLDDERLNEAMAMFKSLCDRKEIVTADDLEAMIASEILPVEEGRRVGLKSFLVQVGSGHGSATVTLDDEGREATDAAVGNGPVDAAYRAIQRILDVRPELEHYSIRSVNESSDAIGEARVTLSIGGSRANGRGASTDVIEASIKAYIDGINRLFAAQTRIAGRDEGARQAV